MQELGGSYVTAFLGREEQIRVSGESLGFYHFGSVSLGV